MIPQLWVFHMQLKLVEKVQKEGTYLQQKTAGSDLLKLQIQIHKNYKFW